MRQIIFDLDDTLYNNQILRTKREEAIIKFLRNKKDIYLKLKKSNGTVKSLEKLGINKERFFNIINSVPINLKQDSKLIEIFKQIKKNFEIIILSNNSYYCVRESLTQLGIINYVKKIYSGQDFENFKPEKECFFMVNPHDVAVGNDYEKDLEIPKSKGAITIHLGENELADFNIKEIYEIRDLLKKLIK